MNGRTVQHALPSRVSRLARAGDARLRGSAIRARSRIMKRLSVAAGAGLLAASLPGLVDAQRGDRLPRRPSQGRFRMRRHPGRRRTLKVDAHRSGRRAVAMGLARLPSHTRALPKSRPGRLPLPSSRRRVYVVDPQRIVRPSSTVLSERKGADLIGRPSLASGAAMARFLGRIAASRPLGLARRQASADTLDQPAHPRRTASRASNRTPRETSATPAANPSTGPSLASSAEGPVRFHACWTSSAANETPSST